MSVVKYKTLPTLVYLKLNFIRIVTLFPYHKIFTVKTSKFSDLLSPGTSTMLTMPRSPRSSSGLFESRHSSTTFFSFPAMIECKLRVASKNNQQIKVIEQTMLSFYGHQVPRKLFLLAPIPQSVHPHTSANHHSYIIFLKVCMW